MESLGRKGDACKWLGSAVKLANIVASDDLSLKLYSLIHRHLIDYIYNTYNNFQSLSLFIRSDLETLLAGINTAATKLLALDPDFTIAE
jgi:hypothetical protein